MMRSTIPLTALVVVALGLGSVSARAGETDQFYAWHAQPHDSTRVFDDYVDARIDDGLAEVNARPWRGTMRCIDVARAMTARLFWIEYAVEFGPPNGWGLRMAPASNTEFQSRYRKLSVYRDVPPWLVFLQLKPRPTVLVHDTFIGLDKVSHFRDEGLNYYAEFHRALDDGASEEEAYDAAMRLGVDEEEGILGRFFTGIFSFADLEANGQGLRFYRDLCDGDAPLLVFHEPMGWTLRERFDFGRYVTPCFDESWQIDSYPEGHKRWMRPALEEYCKMRSRPDLARRHARYRRQGCSAEVGASLARLKAQGVGPPREGTSLDEVCASLR